MTLQFTIVNLFSIDLNLLVVLHAVLEEGSVAKAADRLHVTSPAVSNALNRLRDALNDPLFVRSGRGLVATPRAQELRPALDRVFAELEKSLNTEFDPRTCTQTFTIALSDADQVSSLPAISKHFARELPKAKLLVVTLDTLMSTGGLAGNVDVTIGPQFDGEGLYRERLFIEDTVIVARRKHPRVKNGRLTRELFNSERHVDVHLLLGRPGAGNRMAEEVFTKAGLRRDIAVTAPSFAAVASVVSSTEFLGGMPRRTAELCSRAMPLQVLSGLGPPLQFEMFLHWHERTHRNVAHVAFRRVIVGALQNRHNRGAESR